MQINNPWYRLLIFVSFIGCIEAIFLGSARAYVNWKIGINSPYPFLAVTLGAMSGAFILPFIPRRLDELFHEIGRQIGFFCRRSYFLWISLRFPREIFARLAGIWIVAQPVNWLFSAGCFCWGMAVRNARALHRIFSIIG